MPHMMTILASIVSVDIVLSSTITTGVQLHWNTSGGFAGLRDFVGSDMGFDIPFRKWVNEGNPSNAPGVGVVATKEQSIGYCQPEGC
jgi:hypothetical protein